MRLRILLPIDRVPAVATEGSKMNYEELKAAIANWENEAKFHAAMAADQARASMRTGYGESPQEIRDGARENLVDMLRDKSAHQLVVEAALAAFDAEADKEIGTAKEIEARLCATAQEPDELRRFAVTVLMPLRFRQRKQSLYYYETYAASEEEALTRVEAYLADTMLAPGYEIIGCTEAGSVRSVRMQGSINVTPDEAARRKAVWVERKVGGE